MSEPIEFRVDIAGWSETSQFNNDGDIDRSSQRSYVRKAIIVAGSLLGRCAQWVTSKIGVETTGRDVEVGTIDGHAIFYCREQNTGQNNRRMILMPEEYFWVDTNYIRIKDDKQGGQEDLPLFHRPNQNSDTGTGYGLGTPILPACEIHVMSPNWEADRKYVFRAAYGGWQIGLVELHDDTVEVRVDRE